MARAGLSKNRKFLRLARGLNACASGMGEIMARGVLETLWSAAYERADDYLGDSDDVEIAAGWRGERGALTAMLLEAGGQEAGFVELDSERGGYRVHDLWDHAPPWVKQKAQREAARQADGKSLSDVRREARAKGAAKAKQQPVEQLPANGQQPVDQKATNLAPWDGTGRDGLLDTPRARVRDPGALGTAWAEATGQLTADGLHELAEVLDAHAEAAKLSPAELLKRAVDEFQRYRATCTPPKVPPLSPRKVREHWPRVWEAIQGKKPSAPKRRDEDPFAAVRADMERRGRSPPRPPSEPQPVASVLAEVFSAVKGA